MQHNVKTYPVFTLLPDFFQIHVKSINLETIDFIVLYKLTFKIYLLKFIKQLHYKNIPSAIKVSFYQNAPVLKGGYL